MLSGIQITDTWAYILLIIIIPYLFMRIKLRANRYIDYPPLQYYKVNVLKRLFYNTPLFIEILIIILLIIIISGPYVEKKQEFISQSGIDIAFALDVSASMQAKDFPPNRLEALKTLSKDFIKRNGSNRIAVYVFSKHTFTQTPITTDYAVIMDLIDGLAFEMINHGISGGTAIGDALLMASHDLLKYKINKRDQVIILITDGECNYGISPEIAAKKIKESDIRLYVIGIGGDKPFPVYHPDGKPFIDLTYKHHHTKLNDEGLKKIAQISGGIYFRAKNIDVLAEIFEDISHLEKTPLESEVISLKNYYRPELAFIIFILFCLYLFIEGIIIRRPYR